MLSHRGVRTHQLQDARFARSVARVRLKQSVTQARKIGRRLWGQAPHCRCAFGPLFGYNVVRATEERQPPREELEQHHADGVPVRARPDRRWSSLLGRHVRWRTSPKQRCFIWSEARKSEIEDDHASI